MKCQKYCLSEASYQLGQCPQCSQELCLWSHILKSDDPLVAFDRAIGDVIGRYAPTTVLQTSNGLMPAAGKPMMLNRVLTVPGEDHAELYIGINLCLLVLRPRRSIVLQESLIMSTPGIL